MSRWRRWIRRGILAAALGLGAPAVAQAHHVPGHSASEGVRNFNSLGGGTGQALNRVALLQEVGSNSTSLTPGTVYNTSLIGEYSPHPWVSFGGQFPLLIIDQAPTEVDGRIVDPDPLVGYGDTRAFVRFTPHADKLVHRVLTTAIAASFPTRTVRYLGADPGNIWSVSPTAIYSRTYSRAFWQVLGLLTIEHRPAGTALDTSLGGQVGYRFLRNRLTPAVGMVGDLRVASFCAQPGGRPAEFCPEGRLASERNREVGSLRVAPLAALSYAFSSWGLVSANVQVPIMTKRDFDIAGSFTFQAMF